MTIEDVAKQYKLRTDWLGDELIIPGRLGHLFRWSEAKSDEDIIGAMYSVKDITAKGWNQRRTEWKAAGARVTQNGETDGIVLFPLDREDLLKLSIKLLRVYRRRKTTPQATKKRNASLMKARKARLKS